MIISHLPLMLGSGIVLLAGINFVGVDPADVALLAVLPWLLHARPGFPALLQLTLLCRVQILLFLILYIVSASINPFNASFVFNFLSNLVFFGCIYFLVTLRGARVNFSRLIVLGFFLPLTVQLMLLFSPFSQPSILFESIRDNRFLGMLGDPNLSGLHAIMVVLVVADDMLLTRRLPYSQAVKISLLSLAILVLLATQSRSAWLALAMCLPVYLATAPALFSLGRLVAVGAATLALIVVTGAVMQFSGQGQLVVDRLQSVSEHDSQAEQDRFNLVFTVAAVAVGMQNPLGAGPGMSITATGIENADGNPVGAHNAFVQIFADNGWGATAVMLVTLVTIFRRLTTMGRRGQVFAGVSCRVMLCALVATCTVGMFHDLLSWRIAWLLPSLALICCHLRSPGKLSPQIATKQVAFTG